MKRIPVLKRIIFEKSLRASYSLEAAVVMAMVLFCVSSIIKTSYRWRNQTAGCIRLQEMTEILRHTEGEDLLEKKPQLEVTTPAFELTARYTGNEVIANGEGDGWNLSIQTKRFNPEEFLRMVSLIVK